ncbi:Uncharacterized protein FWK35_00008879 [Aphis craccivora]|uniref:RNA-directed DNA polymerase n=1 Tax=Aphis craccivora TaxID=307492 RepID=A0A6G0YRR5_APHCR|nr:Uncharacterized protein FWK35_00008879 [Aphis craccivora]
MYKKKTFTYVLTTPPVELIESTSYTLNFVSQHRAQRSIHRSIIVIIEYEEIVKYLDKKCSQHKSPPKTVDEMVFFIMNIQDDRVVKYIPNLSNQIQMCATKQSPKSLLNQMGGNSHEFFNETMVISPMSPPTPMSTPPPMTAPPCFTWQSPSRAVHVKHHPNRPQYNITVTSNFDSAVSVMYFVPKPPVLTGTATAYDTPLSGLFWVVTNGVAVRARPQTFTTFLVVALGSSFDSSTYLKSELSSESEAVRRIRGLRKIRSVQKIQNNKAPILKLQRIRQRGRGTLSTTVLVAPPEIHSFGALELQFDLGCRIGRRRISYSSRTNQSKPIDNSELHLIEENPDQSGVQNSYGSREETIGLEAALKLLPGSFKGDKQEELEIFLEKCEFALAYAHDHDVLKSALEPQRTTTYLFSELYSLRQKVGEDITTYANRIEQLKTLIIEQDTSECNWEVAQVLGTSIRKQTIQVYVEDLGPLKDFIKARNPLMLDKPIQSAREEERVRNSQEVIKKLYGLHTNPRRNLFASIASIQQENQQQPTISGECPGSELKNTDNEVIIPGGAEIVLQPRTKTLVEIEAGNHADDEIIIIESQEITKSVMCSNSVTKVQNKRVIDTLINPTEEAIKLKTPNLKELIHVDRIRRLEEALRMDHLNSEERESIVVICQDHSDIFFLEGDRVLTTTAVTHGIKSSEALAPIHVKPYRLPHRHRQEIMDQMEAFERDGVITASESPWNAPLLVVPKKLDVNGQSGKSKYYSTLDMAHEYHQIPMDPADHSKTAWSTDRGHFEFKRMPFGLKGTFQRLMNKVLMGINGIKSFVHLDDIIIYAKNLNDLSQKITEIFQKLRVKPDPQKISCVQQFPIPRNVKEVKSFLGLSGYYIRFIRNYGQIAKLLTSLLKKDVTFRWSDLCQQSFEQLKDLLTQAAEVNYNTTEKELTSILWGIKMYRPYLFGKKLNIVTDHRALLEEYQYTIHFKPEVNNTNVDALIHRVTAKKQSAAISESYPDTPGQNISETQMDNGHKWKVIRDMLRFLFHGSSVHILVYTRDELTEEGKQRAIQEHHENPLGGTKGFHVHIARYQNNTSGKG